MENNIFRWKIKKTEIDKDIFLNLLEQKALSIRSVTCKDKIYKEFNMNLDLKDILDLTLNQIINLQEYGYIEKIGDANE